VCKILAHRCACVEPSRYMIVLAAAADPRFHVLRAPSAPKPHTRQAHIVKN
jgi:hypothetical protein